MLAIRLSTPFPARSAAFFRCPPWSLPAVLLTVSTAVGCNNQASPAPGPAGAEPPPALGPDTPAPGPTASLTVAGVTFDAPGRWEATAPASSVRKAQRRVPSGVSRSGVGDAEFVVFHFGPGQGGGVSENISRWSRQTLDANGAPATASVEILTPAASQANPLRITAARFDGTYTHGPPMGPKTASPGWSSLVAVVEGGPAGSLFLRLVGPQAAVDGALSGWSALLRSASVASRPTGASE